MPISRYQHVQPFQLRRCMPLHDAVIGIPSKKKRSPACANQVPGKQRRVDAEEERRAHAGRRLLACHPLDALPARGSFSRAAKGMIMLCTVISSL